MAKQKKKTRKVIASRVRRTKKGKLKIRKAGQSHFNTRESGKKTRNKRRDKNISKSLRKTINRLT